MSDKHTDAQGSTYNNGPGNVPRLPDRVVDTLIQTARESGGDTALEITHSFAHGVCEELLARLPSSRATEGQAQTSAAVDIGSLKEQADAWMAVFDVLGTVAPGWMDGPHRTGVENAVHAIESLAAQLADSTAPGAPVEEISEALANFLAEHTRLNQDGIDTHAMTMTLALNYAAINPTPEADIAEWREQGYLPLVAAPTAQQSRSDRSPYIFGVKPPLSIAAQQSLTAGGAVQDLPLPTKRYEFTSPDTGWFTAAQMRKYAADWSVDFKNFHRSLCTRFGYTHDEQFWWRDLVSLEEFIASQVNAKASAESIGDDPKFIKYMDEYWGDGSDLARQEFIDYIDKIRPLGGQPGEAEILKSVDKLLRGNVCDPDPLKPILLGAVSVVTTYGLVVGLYREVQKLRSTCRAAAPLPQVQSGEKVTAAMTQAGLDAVYKHYFGDKPKTEHTWDIGISSALMTKICKAMAEVKKQTSARDTALEEAACDVEEQKVGKESYFEIDERLQQAADSIRDMKSNQQSVTPSGALAQTHAARDVLAERRRQIDVEGYHNAHDDGYGEDGELARGAACYAYPELVAVSGLNAWPWDEKWWKPRDQRRNYVIAAALLLAEIERIDRASGALADNDGGVA